MARKYTEVTAKVELSAVATYKYTCENCGTESTFDIPYSKDFQASVQDAPYEDHRGAEIKANQMAYEKALSKQREIENGKNEGTDLEPRPCPDCGYTQSWMVTWIRKKHRLLAIILSIASFFVWGLLLPTALESIGIWSPPETPSLAAGCLPLLLIAAFMTGTYFLVMYITGRADPNQEFENVERINRPQITWSEIKISPSPEEFKKFQEIRHMLNT